MTIVPWRDADGRLIAFLPHDSAILESAPVALTAAEAAEAAQRDMIADGQAAYPFYPPPFSWFDLPSAHVDSPGMFYDRKSETEDQKP